MYRISTKEGITFTPFDNRTFFTRPWDNFCITTPPSCQKPFLQKPGMIGEFPAGCHCKEIGIATSPPSIENNCYELDYNYFYK